MEDENIAEAQAVHDTTEKLAEMKIGVGRMVELCHAASHARGWWHDPITGKPLIPVEALIDATPMEFYKFTVSWFPYVIGTKIALIHSEVSEGLEAFRTDAMDDKVRDFAGITAEMADAMIRIADLMGALKFQALNAPYEIEDGKVDAEKYKLPEAIYEKMLVNAVRPDHNPETRRKPGGKKF